MLDDPASQAHVGEAMPTDPSRMVTGGFRSLVGYATSAAVDQGGRNRDRGSSHPVPRF